MTTPRAKVLLIAKRPDLAAMITPLLDAGYAVTTPKNAAEALRLASAPAFQSVILDTTNDEYEAVLAAAVRSLSDPAVLCCAEAATVENAVSAMRLGAADFFVSPLDARVVLSAMARSLEKRSQMQELVSLRKVVEVFSSLHSL